MKLEILTPDKKLFNGAVKSINLPGKKGQFMVLQNHAPIVSTLSAGDINIVTDDFKEESISVKGGVVEVKLNHVIVLADI